MFLGCAMRLRASSMRKIAFADSVPCLTVVVTRPDVFPGGGREGSRGGKEQEVKEERGLQAPEVDCPMHMHATDWVCCACRRLRERRETRETRERRETRAWKMRVLTAATMRRRLGEGAGVEEGGMTRRKSLCFQG